MLHFPTDSSSLFTIRVNFKDRRLIYKILILNVSSFTSHPHCILHSAHNSSMIALQLTKVFLRFCFHHRIYFMFVFVPAYEGGSHLYKCGWVLFLVNFCSWKPHALHPFCTFALRCNNMIFHRFLLSWFLCSHSQHHN